MFKYSENKEDERGGVAIKSSACKTPIHAITRYYINGFLEDGYKVGDNRLPYHNNKPSDTGNIYQPVYKEEWIYNQLYHRREYGFQRDSENLMG